MLKVLRSVPMAAAVSVTVQGTSECEGESGAVALVTPSGPRNVLSGLPSVLEGGTTAVRSCTSVSSPAFPTCPGHRTSTG